MRSCQQSPKETVWEHCQSVSRTYFGLLADPQAFPLPQVFVDKWNFITQSQTSGEVVRNYLEWHDCGKPFVRQTDVEGKTHFPNHAEVSQKLFLEAGGTQESAKLIGLDMIFHICKPDEILAMNLDTSTLVTLMLAAWASLFSNAQMFGGYESESFKIKKSQLTKRCKKVLNV